MDAGDLHPHVLKGANGGVASRAGAGDDDVELADAMLACPAGRFFGCHLGGVWGRLARSFEPDGTTGSPNHGVAALVGDGDDGVVEGGLDMSLPMSDVLPLAPANPFWCVLQLLPASAPLTYFFTFFLPAMATLGPLRVRALVWVRWPRTGRPRRCLTP